MTKDGAQPNLARKDTTSSGGGEGRRACNGFWVIPEIPAVTIADQNVAQYSLPAEALCYDPPKDLLVYCFKNGDKERKIHCNTPLEKEELDQLQRMQQQARKDNFEFYPSVCVMATRFLSRARGDVKKALQLMVDTQQWRSSYFANGPIADTSVIEDLSHGIVYFAGRDKALRPTIICRANRIPAQWYKDKSTDRLLRIVIFCMEYMVRYMLVPGKVEGNNLIVDLKGMSASQVPLKELSKLYSVMSHHYIGRVFKFYIVNLSGMLSMIASAAKGLLTDRQKQKLNVLNSVEQLREDFALHQLEEDHGGTRPTIKEFFPFPLESGPFEAGYAKGASGGVKRVDRVFSAANCHGRLWDAKRSTEENSRLDFTVEAIEVLKSIGMEVPQHLVEKADRIAAKKKKAEEADQKPSNGDAAPEKPVSDLPLEAKVENGPSVGIDLTAKSPSTPAVVSLVEAHKEKESIQTSPTTTAASPAVIEEEDEEEGMQEMIYPEPEREDPLIEREEVSPKLGVFGLLFSCNCCTVGGQRP
eukprot:TRINITY_DN80001_c0_g1_i1.p1 TRINITY_DN80001_c0_g1~~TRINITY_DN80001_c0_g1_i1.p1  ORF type:complete len:529 (-),score=121.33 TRINITY_DN80001_c0_g1_i1:164-1750(-)